MATPTNRAFVKFPEVDEAQNLLTCEICTEIFNRAKNLPYGHTFCQECLKKWAKTNEDKELSCPNCRTPWKMPAEGIEKLPTNYLATSMINFFSTGQEEELVTDIGTDPKTCEFCESKEATSACVECRQLACDICAKGHKRTKAMASHLVVSLEEYGTNYENHPARLTPSECDQHPGIQLKYYCQTCFVPTCLECTITDHRVPEHKHIYLSEAARDARNLINDTQVKVADRLKCFDEKKANVRGIKEKLTNSKEQAVIEVEKQSKELMKKIQESKNGTLKLINYAYEGKAKILDSKLDRLELATGQVKSSFGHSKNLVELGTDVELMSVHKQTQEILETLLKEKIQEGPHVDHHLQYSPDPAFANGRQGSVQSLPVLPLLTVNVVGNKGNKPGEFNFPSGVAVTEDGDIFITDFYNYRIQVFDIGGQYKRHFPIDCNGQKVQPSDVAFNREDHLVIADSAGKQICVCDTDGKLVRHFGKEELKNPRLLAISSDGLIHVTDWDGKFVKTFTPEGGLVRTIGCKGDQPGQFKCPHSIAVNSKDQIIVTDYHSHHVKVFDPSGAFLFTCGKQGVGEGELQFPRGVTVDQCDNIFVCDGGQ